MALIFHPILSIDQARALVDEARRVAIGERMDARGDTDTTRLIDELADALEAELWARSLLQEDW